ncbi:MAG: ROK family protein [Thermoleophilia bacterium]
MADSAAIGIDVGGTKIAGVLLDADMTVADRARLDTPPDQDELIATVAAMAGALALRARRPVAGVGVGVPAMVAQPEGRALLSMFARLGDVPVRALLEERTGRRVVVDNDGNLAALAEHRLGAAAGTGTSITFTVGTGVGGGVVLDGALMRGAGGRGAELGHIPVRADGPPCPGRCPGRGCLEALASGTALARALGVPDARTVLHRADAGDEEAARVVDEAGVALGVAMAGLANVFNPEVFVVGGGLGMAAGERLLAPARRELAARALPPNAGARVVPARLGELAGAIGAAVAARDITR